MTLRNDVAAVVDPRAIAIHEAGHAVVAYALNIKILSAAMNPDCTGCVTTEDEPETADTESDRELLKKHMMVAVAGDQAERRAGYAPDTGRCGKDYEHAKRIAWTLQPNRGAFDLPIKAHATTEIVLAYRDVWAAVEAVANRLIQTKQLSGKEVDSIISEYLGPPGGFVKLIF